MTAVCVATLFSVAALFACEGSTYRIWIPPSSSADALYRFTEGDKAGYIDQTGKVVIPPTFRFLDGPSGAEFHDGLLEIGVSDGIYVDRSGKKIIDKGFYRGWDFSEGLAVAMPKSGGKWGYIDNKGESVISPRFESSQDSYVWPFEGGFAKIEVKGLFGYIDHPGEFAVPPGFPEAEGFHDGMVRVVAEGPCTYVGSRVCPEVKVLPRGSNVGSPGSSCKYTFTDKAGHTITEKRFDDAKNFSEGLAPVRIGIAWGYLDKSGHVAIEPSFGSAEPFSNGLALVSSGERIGYIDRTGTYVIPRQFKYAESFAEGLAVVGDNESGYWYIDKTGCQNIADKFALASPFFKGLAHVQLVSPDGTKSVSRGKFAYIDHTGRRVFTYAG